MIAERGTFVEATMKRHWQRGAHIATRMTLANKLKVTRLISSPGVFTVKNKLVYLRKKRPCRPVTTLSRVMMAIKGRRALIASSETFNDKEENI